MSHRCRSPKEREEEEPKKQKDILINSYYYNPIESDQITEAMSDYYMFITLKNWCQNLNYSLVLDSKDRKVTLNLESTVPDRVEYEELKIYAQKYEEEQRKMTGKFPYVPKDPRIEWSYPDVLGGYNPQKEVQNEEGTKDDFQKDPDWKQ